MEMEYGNDVNMETVERLLKDLEFENPKRFSHVQLKTFTSNFSRSLGSGGFGDVYKGVLHNGMRVAVKVLKGELLSDGVKEQFKAEVSVLGKTHHRNLVKLYGFCFESSMKALVYEFMENESLEKILYGRQSIKWETLWKIVIGTANGLSYLHKDCQPCVIHYDIKPSNILLDSEFSPKIGDFGLAKLLNQERTHITESRFRGTPTYAAPELLLPYSSTTHKCDVYSFGITLFDIIGRRKMVAGEGQKWFPRQVWKKFEEEQQEEIMEECNIKEENREQATRILLVALWCVQFLPDDRPSMSRVVRLLKGGENIAMPPNPFLFLGSSGASGTKHSTGKKLPSVKAASSFVSPTTASLSSTKASSVVRLTPTGLPSARASSSLDHTSAPNRAQGFTSFSKYLDQPMRGSLYFWEQNFQDQANTSEGFTSFSKYLDQPMHGSAYFWDKEYKNSEKH